MTLPDFLWADKYGEVVIRGHRITLYHVVTKYQDGYSAEMIADYFPTLPIVLVYKVLAFYLDNKSEVDTYVKEMRAEIDRQAGTPPRGPTFDELKRRMAARTVAESA